MQGESPYKLAPGADADAEAEGDSSEEETGGGGAAGTVYRLSKGQLRRLEGGMEQYEEQAARAAARLGARMEK